jgi:DNA-binding beta-propeller fold protein YncE
VQIRYAAVAGALLLAFLGLAQEARAEGPYKLLKVVKVGGAGGFDYVYADVDGRRLYIPRPGAADIARITVFNLDTLASVGEIPKSNARGVAVDPKSHHGFGSSKPVVMWDTRTLATIKTIDVEGRPDGIMFDPFNARVWVFSHAAPNATVINAKDGSIAGTVDLGGAPEQAVSDGKGRIWVDIEDKDSIAAVDAKTLKVTAHYDLKGKCGGPGGLALDEKHHILFAACHEPATMAILSAEDGKLITNLPIGTGVDGAGFNPHTMEAFSSQADGTLTVIKENSPTSFEVEQTVKTKPGARTMTIDTKTDQIFSITGEFGPVPAGQRRGPMLPDTFSIVVVGK